MKKIFLSFTLILPLLNACSNSSPEPKTWQKDLNSVQAENVNKNIHAIIKNLEAPQKASTLKSKK